MSDERTSEEAMRITNSFIFGKEAYSNIASHSHGFPRCILGRFSGKVILGLCIPATPLATLFLLTFFGYFSEGNWESPFFLTFPVFELVCIVVGIHSFWRFDKTPLKPQYRFKLDEVFTALHADKGVAFSMYLDEDMQERSRKEIKAASKAFRKKLKEDPSYGPGKPYEVQFSATITDDGIYIGTSQKPFITDYRTEIWDEFESKEYYAISRYDKITVVFEKRAFRGASRNQVKAFIKDKQKGKEALLADYANNPKLT